MIQTFECVRENRNEEQFDKWKFKIEKEKNYIK